MQRALSLFACAGILLAAPAQAQEGDTERTGVYLSAEISGLFPVSLQEHFETNQSLAAGADPSLGAGARVGYRLHRNFAVEAQYQYIKTYEAFVEQMANIEVSGHAFTVNAKAFWPLDRLHPFALIGVGMLDSDVSATGVMAQVVRAQSLEGTGALTRFGVGTEIYLTDHIGMTLTFSYLLPFENQKRLDAVSISGGVQYRF